MRKNEKADNVVATGNIVIFTYTGDLKAQNVCTVQFLQV